VNRLLSWPGNKSRQISQILQASGYIEAVICAGLILALPLAAALGRCDRAGGEVSITGASSQKPLTEALPADPFQRCAVRALAGEFGALAPWQREAYTLGLERGVTVKGKAFVTAYYPWEGRSGRVDCKGNPCTKRTAAANRLPYGTYVWVADPCGMRQVLDRGARSNDRVADRRGCDLWVDLWMTRRLETHVSGYAVVGETEGV